MRNSAFIFTSLCVTVVPFLLSLPRSASLCWATVVFLQPFKAPDAGHEVQIFGFLL